MSKRFGKRSTTQTSNKQQLALRQRKQDPWITEDSSAAQHRKHLGRVFIKTVRRKRKVEHNKNNDNADNELCQNGPSREAHKRKETHNNRHYANTCNTMDQSSAGQSSTASIEFLPKRFVETSRPKTTRTTTTQTMKYVTTVRQEKHNTQIKQTTAGTAPTKAGARPMDH